MNEMHNGSYTQENEWHCATAAGNLKRLKQKKKKLSKKSIRQQTINVAKLK